MKIKFPKKIRLGDREFLVEQNKRKVDGEFYYYDDDKKKGITVGKIIIGTKLIKTYPSVVLNTIIHELKEIIQEEQGVRYKRPDTHNTFEFHYDHRHHTDFCSRLAGLLNEFLE